jgi:hypothetical protein
MERDSGDVREAVLASENRGEKYSAIFPTVWSSALRRLPGPVELHGQSGAVIPAEYPVPSWRSLGSLIRFVLQHGRLPALP